MGIKRYSLVLGLVMAALMLMGPIGIIVGFGTLTLVVLAVVAGVVLGLVTK